MQKYFISPQELLNKQITGEDVFHITNVMRCCSGTRVIVSDQTNEFLVELTEITKKSVSFKIIEERNGSTELPFFVTLFQGYPKGDKLDDIIKHSVELGIYDIYPTFTKRSVYKLAKEKYENKLQRFNRISKEAAEQSNRRICPKVVNIIDLEKIDFSEFNHKIVCYEESAKNDELRNFKEVIKKLKPNDRVCVLIGPEGGLDETEIRKLQEQGFVLAGLGPRILRTETAIMYVMSAISYEWELK